MQAAGPADRGLSGVPDRHRTIPNTIKAHAPDLQDCFTFLGRQGLDWRLSALLHDSGIRIGEALGARHQDLAAAERTVTVQSRVNDNGARPRSRTPRTIPVPAER